MRGITIQKIGCIKAGMMTSYNFTENESIPAFWNHNPAIIVRVVIIVILQLLLWE